jgi:cytochrome c oxidase accessory protein FixG
VTLHVEQLPPLLKPGKQERVLSTMEADGSRRWLYPRLARGKFWERRRMVAYALIGIYALLPHLHLAGRPVILLDLIHRRFTLLCKTFLPTDTPLLTLLLVTVILSIFFITALLGRVWCGWACPQTVYMEFLFRPIERMFTEREGVGGKPPRPVPAWRKGLMYLTYLVVCAHLANTFLAYFVPPATLNSWILGSPLKHPTAFLVFAGVTALMLFDFGWFREQTCLIACPYGRLQSVLMDRQSLVISYDEKRGEPRGKMKRASLPVVDERVTGDCVDCFGCVQVCPTGIDIRDGLQFECIGCAQCIDACDAVMRKIGRPQGLIRYGSQAGMAGEPTRILRPRVLVYSLIITVVAGLLTFLLATKSPVDVPVLRNVGRPFVLTDRGEVENTMRVKITNRTDRAMPVTFAAVGRGDVRVVATNDRIDVKPGEAWTEPVQIIAPRGAFTLGALDVTIRVSGGERINIDRPCRLLGPIGEGSGK